jgi:hypothetical protein
VAPNLANEPKLGDQRPRERVRDRRTLRSVAIGAPVGAVLFVIAVWLISLVGSGHPSALIYVGAAVIGAAVGPVLLPFVTLARADGADADIVAARTPAGSRADAPLEGAQEADHESSSPRP